MATILALESLFDAVVERFECENTNAAQTFGWREPSKQLQAFPRIVWVPGNPTGGIGSMGPARFPGRTPRRPIATLAELCTVTISAEDTSDSRNERLQYHAARVLFDAWYRAVYKHARQTHTIESVDWVISKNENRRGASVRVVLAILSMIPDAPLANAPADTGAAITPELLDQTDPDILEPTP